MRTPDSRPSSELLPHASIPLISLSRSPSPYARKHSNSNVASEADSSLSSTESAARLGSTCSSDDTEDLYGRGIGDDDDVGAGRYAVSGTLSFFARLVPSSSPVSSTSSPIGAAAGRPGSGRRSARGRAPARGRRRGLGARRGTAAWLFGGRSLGRWLLGTSTGWQIFVAIMGMLNAGSIGGLTFVNRLILLTGVYKFTYPLTVTLVQFLITHLVLCFLAALTRFFAAPLARWGFAGIIAPARPVCRGGGAGMPASRWSSTPSSVPGRWWGRIKSVMVGQGGIAGGGVLGLDPQMALRMLPLAIVFFAMVLLSNLSFSYTTYSMYTLYRIGIVPLSIFLTARLTRSSHSIGTLSSSLTATLNLLIATSQSGVRVTWESIVSGIFSSVFVALYPILVLRTHRRLVSSLVPQGDLLTAYSPPVHAVRSRRHRRHSHDFPPDTDDPFTTTVNAASSHSPKEDTIATYHMLHYTSLLSTLILLPITLLSGEVGDISRNCYFLDLPFFWFLMVSSALLATAVFVTTVLFAQATTTPVTVSFVGSVPPSVFLLWILSAPSFRLPVHTWVGLALCAGSCLWFMAGALRSGPGGVVA